MKKIFNLIIILMVSMTFLLGYESIYGTVVYNSYSLPGQNGGNPTNQSISCPYLRVMGRTYNDLLYTYSDGNGIFTLEPGPDRCDISVSLQGQYVIVCDYLYGEENTEIEGLWNGDTVNFVLNSPAHYDEYFLYDYMNRAWHKFSDKISLFNAD
ncbi:MAG: hypothetical protein ACOWWR_06450, partial [Eubacteriales bacterium]